MKTRIIAIVVIAILGATCGPVVLGGLASSRSPLAWSIYPLVFFGAALGLPLLLASVVSSGRYQTMVQLWSAFGALGILLLAAGASATCLSLASSRLEPYSILAFVLGAGMLAGLVFVKLATRKSRANGA